MSLDLALFEAIHSLAGISVVGDWAIVFFAEYFPFVAGATLALLLYREHLSRIKMVHLFLIALMSGVIARVSVIFFHTFLARERPYLHFGFDPLVMERSFSFPSGHAAFFFAFAMAVYMHNRVWGAVYFACALLIGIARVAAGVHYPSDILGGALLGIIVAYILVRGVRAFGTLTQ